MFLLRRLLPLFLRHLLLPILLLRLLGCRIHLRLPPLQLIIHSCEAVQGQGPAAQACSKVVHRHLAVWAAVPGPLLPCHFVHRLLAGSDVVAPPGRAAAAAGGRVRAQRVAALAGQGTLLGGLRPGSRTAQLTQEKLLQGCVFRSMLLQSSAA